MALGLFLLGLVLTSALANVNFHCPQDWVKDVYRCYRYFGVELEFPDAEKYCNGFGANLAYPGDYEEQTFIGTNVVPGTADTKYWIGLTRANSFDSNDLAWTVDMSKAIPVATVGFWGPGQPIISSIKYTYTYVERALTTWYPYNFRMFIVPKWSVTAGFVCQRRACLDNQVVCYNGACAYGTLCDGHDDCGDFTDESNCGDSQRTVDGITYKSEVQSTPSSIHISSTYAVPSLRQQWGFQGAVDKRVNVLISDFNLEVNVDWLRVWVGALTTLQGDLLASLTGRAGDGRTFSSYNNLMLLTFSTDSTVMSDGFMASWTTEPLSPVYNAVQSVLVPATITLVAGDITTRLRRTWCIMSADISSVVTLQITKLKVSPATAGQFIYIVNGADSIGLELVPSWNAYKDTDYVMSLTNAMFVHLSTDHELPEAEFTFRYWLGCDMTLEQEAAVVVSPGRPVNRNYPLNLNCTWRVMSSSTVPLQAYAVGQINFGDPQCSLKIWSSQTISSTSTTRVYTANMNEQPSLELNSDSVAYIVEFISQSPSGQSGSGFEIRFGKACNLPAAGISINLGQSHMISCTGYQVFVQSQFSGINPVTLFCDIDGWHLGDAQGTLVPEQPICMDCVLASCYFPPAPSTLCIVGSFVPTFAVFTCACYGDFTGTFCDTSADDCLSNPCGIEGSQCVDGNGEAFCDCTNKLKTGYSCVKDKDFNYNLYFTSKSGQSKTQFPFELGGRDFGIFIKVKCNMDSSCGTFLTLFGAKLQYDIAPSTKLLSIDSTKVSLNLGSSEEDIPYQYMLQGTAERTLLLKYTSTDSMLTVAVDLDGSTSTVMNTLADGETLPDFGRIVLGATSEENGFTGYVSQVFVWNDPSQLTPDTLISDTNIADFQTGLVSTWSDYVLVRDCYIGARGVTSATPGPTAPSIMCLSDDMEVNLNNRSPGTTASWTSQVTSTGTLTAIYPSDFVFGWGVYSNAIISCTGNLCSLCTYKIYVRPQASCVDYHLANPASIDCTQVPGICIPMCTQSRVTSIPTPAYYTCDDSGHYSVANPYSLPLFLLDCTEPGTDGFYTFRILITYQSVSSCESRITATQQSQYILSAMASLSTSCASCSQPTVSLACVPEGTDTSLIVTVDATNTSPSVPTDTLEQLVSDISGPTVTPTTSITFARACPEGTKIEITSDTHTCVQCPAGTFQKDAMTCEPCARNTYQENPGQTNCVACPDGKITIAIGSIGVSYCIEECPAGQVTETSQIDSGSCSDCEASVSRCVDCEAGYYQDRPGMVGCIPCPHDRISNPGSDSDVDCVVPCGAGMEAFEGRTECTACRRGYYRAADAPVPTCYECEIGETTANIGSTAVENCYTICDAGMFYHLSVGACEPCPRGKYQPRAGRTSCVDCEAGLTTETEGATMETQCQRTCLAGYQPNPATTQCVPCNIGSYKIAEGWSACTPCSDGKTTASEGATLASQCYTICEAGMFYHPSVGTCEPCPRGQYQPMAGRTNCVDCEAGLTTETEGVTMETQCLRDCPAGQQTDSTDSAQCVKCPRGFYKTVAGPTLCTACADGLTTASTGTTDASECTGPTVTYVFYLVINIEYSSSALIALQELITALLISKLPSTTVIVIIIAHAPGSLQVSGTVTVTGQTSTPSADQVQSALATYPNAIRASAALNPSNYVCTGGMHLNTTGSIATCDPCPMNTYQPAGQQDVCTACPTNRSTVSTGSTSLTDCIYLCASDYCQNGGVCLNSTAALACLCTSDYDGVTCSVPRGQLSAAGHSNESKIISGAIGGLVGLVLLVVVGIFIAMNRRKPAGRKSWHEHPVQSRDRPRRRDPYIHPLRPGMYLPPAQGMYVPKVSRDAMSRGGYRDSSF